MRLSIGGPKIANYHLDKVPGWATMPVCRAQDREASGRQGGELADAADPISYYLPRAGSDGGFLLTADWSPTDLRLLQSLLPAPLVDSLAQPAPPAYAVAEASARLEAALAALVPFVPAPVRDIHLAQDTPTRIPGLYL